MLLLVGRAFTLEGFGAVREMRLSALLTSLRVFSGNRESRDSSALLGRPPCCQAQLVRHVCLHVLSIWQRPRGYRPSKCGPTTKCCLDC